MESRPNFSRMLSIAFSIEALLLLLLPPSEILPPTSKKESWVSESCSTKLIAVSVMSLIGLSILHDVLINSSAPSFKSWARSVGDWSCFCLEMSLNSGSRISTLTPDALSLYERSLLATVSESPVRAVRISFSPFRFLVKVTPFPTDLILCFASLVETGLSSSPLA